MQPKRIVRYNKIAPADSFLGRYLKHNEGIETAHAYDFWCGLWLLSLAVGREVYVGRPKAPVFFNLYVILCAESGTTRKSTAVGYANKVAHVFNKSLPHENAYWLVENKCTTEQLMHRMSNQTLERDSARIGITVGELVTFLGREAYSVTLPGTMTDLYDCPTERFGGGTIGRGSFYIRNVYITFLSASTPTWLIRAINPDVIEGGFTSRCMFIVAEKRKQKIAWPARTDASPLTIEALAAELIKIRDATKLLGPMGINEGALKFFRRWYNSRLEHRDPYRSSFESREDAHILKIAGLLSINDGSYVIQAGHVKDATAIINEVKMDGASMFEGSGSRSKTIIAIDLVRDALLASGMDPLSRTNLHAKVRGFLDREKFAAVMDIMVELGIVQQFETLRVGAGRPGTLYRGTKALTGKDVTSSITERLMGESL
jgi:hypothetical protein